MISGVVPWVASGKSRKTWRRAGTMEPRKVCLKSEAALSDPSSQIFGTNTFASSRLRGHDTAYHQVARASKAAIHWYWHIYSSREHIDPTLSPLAFPLGSATGVWYARSFDHHTAWSLCEFRGSAVLAAVSSFGMFVSQVSKSGCAAPAEVALDGRDSDFLSALEPVMEMLLESDCLQPRGRFSRDAGAVCASTGLLSGVGFMPKLETDVLALGTSPKRTLLRAREEAPAPEDRIEEAGELKFLMLRELELAVLMLRVDDLGSNKRSSGMSWSRLENEARLRYAGCGYECVRFVELSIASKGVLGLEYLSANSSAPALSCNVRCLDVVQEGHSRSLDSKSPLLDLYTVPEVPGFKECSQKRVLTR